MPSKHGRGARTRSLRQTEGENLAVGTIPDSARASQWEGCSPPRPLEIGTETRENKDLGGRRTIILLRRSPSEAAQTWQVGKDLPSRVPPTQHILLPNRQTRNKCPPPRPQSPVLHQTVIHGSPRWYVIFLDAQVRFRLTSPHFPSVPTSRKSFAGPETTRPGGRARTSSVFVYRHYFR